MAKKQTPDDGGPANPVLRGSEWLDDKECAYHGSAGMSLRDWFAGQVAAAKIGRGLTAREIADSSYQVADAMLTERGRPAKK